MAARNIVRFTPLDGVPDADVRGMGTFAFDDGSVEVTEDQELADLVKSYQDTLPALEAQPDQRLAMNDPASMAAPPPVPGLDPSGMTAQDFGASAPMDPGAGMSSTPSQVADFQQNAQPDGAAPVAPPPMPMPGAPPSDAAQAADLHRMQAQQAMRGSYVPGQKAGWQEQSRQGALPEEMAQRQLGEQQQSQQDLLTATQERMQAEVDLKRKSALDEAMRLTVQREAQQRAAEEAEERQRRLRAERQRVNDEKIDQSYAQGNGFRQVLGFLGASILGATGSDAGLRMMEANVENHVRQQMQIRGSKLQALAEEIGSEEQAVAGAKAKIYELAARETANTQKLYDAAGIEHNIPAVLKELNARHVAANQEFERQSLGKRVEVYQQGRAAHRTGPDLAGAAKHMEAASKLSPKEQVDILEGLDSKAQADFIARAEGLADGEHSLNEVDRNIGIQRDEAGNIINEKDLGNIEGAGGLGGRVPDSLSSEKGAALAREQRRLTRAAVKATSGASATDTEYERIEKDVPLTDEKDLLNATSEQRRIWQKNYAKAVSLYGKERVDRFMGGYRGTRANINARRGQVGNTGSARGQKIQIDGGDS